MAYYFRQSVSFNCALAKQSSRSAVYQCDRAVERQSTVKTPSLSFLRRKESTHSLVVIHAEAGIQPSEDLYNRLNLLRISSTIILSAFFIPLKVSISLALIRRGSSKAKVGYEVKNIKINPSIVTICFIGTLHNIEDCRARYNALYLKIGGMYND